MSKVLVAFGGVSPEHEVAIISALQVMNALKEGGHEVIPLYVTKAGHWVRGDERFLKPETYKQLEKTEKMGSGQIITPDQQMPILAKGTFGFGKEDFPDVIFPVFHGNNGEDGTMQGLFTLAGLPFVGCGVTASAVGMDKFIAKTLAAQIGLNVVEGMLVTRHDWETEPETVLKLAKELSKTWFVKPVTLGSSIGVNYAPDENGLKNSIEVAFAYDNRVLIERAIEKPYEVNISILGNDPYELSITEHPISSSEVLSFEDKYMRGGKGSKGSGMASLSRQIPADLTKKQEEQVQELAETFFRALGGRGLARLDCMFDKNGKLYFNEINTLPGSFSFYLWEKSGYTFAQLADKLVKLAIEEWQGKQKLITTFDSNILAGYSASSAKGSHS